MTNDQVSTIDAAALAAWLTDGEELALLDAREQGVYFRSHLFRASCVPISQLELLLGDLVPRRSTRLVWCDDGASGLAERAAQRATALGWDHCQVLEGGTAGWSAWGGELYAGVNVPSKAFGEHIEHTFDTPRISARQLKEMLDSNEDLVILDSRPFNEFRRMSIPTGTDCPGAELVHRVKELVERPETLVVVNCAGRTRSIIGAQSLINAGLENRVVALENGTMGWHLAGFEVASGQETHAPSPAGDRRQWAEQAATDVARRFGVQSVDWSTVASWQDDPERTTVLLDVRSPEEFEAGHLPGSRNAPGGQLVQATDEYVATWQARIVLIDDNGVRATMTASWLRQLGWRDAVVLARGVDVVASDHGVVLQQGPHRRPDLVRQVAAEAPTITVLQLARHLAAGTKARPQILDLGDSLKYRQRGHIPGAWWGVRSRLEKARQAIGDADMVVLTSSDGQIARLAVAEAQTWWPDAEILALAGGTRAWRHAEEPMEQGFSRPTTTPDDIWYKPYDHEDGQAETHMREYLSWEIALVEQLRRDPTVQFPSFPPA